LREYISTVVNIDYKICWLAPKK